MIYDGFSTPKTWQERQKEIAERKKRAQLKKHKETCDKNRRNRKKKK